MFIHLGLLNILRQVGRSLLAVLAMTLAALSLSAALSYDDGIVRSSYQLHRELIGGEILVSRTGWSGQKSADGMSGANKVTHQVLQRTGLNRLEVFYPELYREGFLGAVDGDRKQGFTVQELEQLCAETNITGATVKQQLPVELSGSAIGHQYSFSLQQLPAKEYLELFESPKSTQSDLPLVWINKYVSFSDEQMAWALSQLPTANFDGMSVADRKAAERDRAADLLRSMMRLPKRGDKVQMFLPKIRTDGLGEYAVDATDPVSIEVEIAGAVSIPTRTISWPGELDIESETAYLHGANLYVTADTWERIWASAAPLVAKPLYNVTLQVADLDRLQSTVDALAQKFPQFAFIDVSQFAARMEQTTRLDRFYRAPRYVYSQAENASLVIPAALGPAVGCLLLLIAALLIASRMLTGAAARRMEIGILKTLGARRKDIMLMALTEALLIALLGSFAGFSLLRLFGLLTELSNGVPWSEMLWRTVRDGGLVMSVACVTSLLFALLPAIRLSRLSVMEVLRGD